MQLWTLVVEIQENPTLVSQFMHALPDCNLTLTCSFTQTTMMTIWVLHFQFTTHKDIKVAGGVLLNHETKHQLKTPCHV